MLGDIRNAYLRRGLVLLFAPFVMLLSSFCVGLDAAIEEAQDLWPAVRSAWKGSATTR